MLNKASPRSLNVLTMFTVINPLRSADFTVAYFGLKKIVFDPLLQVAAGSGFAAAEDTRKGVCGMDDPRVGEEL